jgi:hypothetical protein
VAVVVQRFVQQQYADSEEYGRVMAVADALFDHLNSSTVQELMRVANVPKASSASIQSTFLEYARGLGFVDESRGLFERYANRLLRPDYYLPLPDTGILLEVERGKTTTNNMDFLDFWKCHLCEHANYLFLLVPQELRHNDRPGSPKREFNSVVKRLSSFFDERNYTNVRGLEVFGY